MSTVNETKESLVKVLAATLPEFNLSSKVTVQTIYKDEIKLAFTDEDTSVTVTTVPLALINKRWKEDDRTFTTDDLKILAGTVVTLTTVDGVLNYAISDAPISKAKSTGGKTRTPCFGQRSMGLSEKEKALQSLLK